MALGDSAVDGHGRDDAVSVSFGSSLGTKAKRAVGCVSYWLTRLGRRVMCRMGNGIQYESGVSTLLQSTPGSPYDSDSYIDAVLRT